MTSLRFVGDLPLWLGLVLALIVCAMSWAYYSRESFDLPRRLKWFLPLLRSLAFFLGIMILAGPVLHHRTIIGELSKVKIYLDTSRSMTMQDRHMSPGRKLMIAEQLGWITTGHVDATLLHVADDLADVRREFTEGLAAQQELAARISGLESDLQLLQVDQKSSAEKAKSAGKEIAALQKVRRAAGAGCTWRWAANGCLLGARMPSHFIPPPPPPLPALLKPRRLLLVCCRRRRSGWPPNWSVRRTPSRSSGGRWAS